MKTYRMLIKLPGCPEKCTDLAQRVYIIKNFYLACVSMVFLRKAGGGGIFRKYLGLRMRKQGSFYRACQRKLHYFKTLCIFIITTTWICKS